MLRLHPALERFVPLEEVSAHGPGGPRHRTLLARSKAKNLVSIEVLAEVPIPSDLATALSRAASTIARLDHAAIVQSRAFVLEADLAAVVTEFVPGVSLQRLLRFASGRGVRLPDDVGWYVAMRVLAALAHAHRDGEVVHGSVSPNAVVVGWDGTTKLGDFAGWKLRSLAASLGTREHDDVPEIVAPEVARGGERTMRGDVFGAALLAMRIATGRTPYARHREGSAKLMIAMSEGELTPLSKTRPDLPAAFLAAMGRALEPDPEKRTITAQELHDAVLASFDPEKALASTTALLARWKEPLQKSVTPWEQRASRFDLEKGEDEPPPSREHEPALALATPDERPSTASLVSAASTDDEPWNKDKVPADEMALGPTDPMTSLSRVGATSADALSMPPLPPVRITAPPLPVYGGPAVNLPRSTKQPFFRGPVAAITIAVIFALLLGGAYFVLKSLSGPPGH